MSSLPAFEPSFLDEDFDFALCLLELFLELFSDLLSDFFEDFDFFDDFEDLDDLLFADPFQDETFFSSVYITGLASSFTDSSFAGVCCFSTS